MGRSLRVVLIDRDSICHRITRRQHEQLYDGTLAMPQFANERLRVAEAVLELKNRRPVEIVRVWLRYWSFDSAGYLDKTKIDEEAAARMDRAYREMSGAFPAPPVDDVVGWIGLQAEKYLRS